MDMNKKQCTVKDLCEYYNVSRTTIEKWMKKRKMPFIREGRKIYFIVSDVEKWYRENNKTVKYNYEKTSAN